MPNRNEEKQKRKEKEEGKTEQMRKETAEYKKNLADLQNLRALQDIELEQVRKKIDEQGNALKKKEEGQMAGLLEDVCKLNFSLVACTLCINSRAGTAKHAG